MTLPTSRGAIHAPEKLSSIVERVDLFALVARYSGPGRAAGRVVTYSCPNPTHPDNHPSFTVTTNKAGRQVARCFSQCNWQGDALELVKWLEGISTGEAAKWLRNYLGDKLNTHFLGSGITTPSPYLLSISRKVEDNSERVTGERGARFMERYLASREWPASVVEQFSLEVVLDSSGACRIRHPYFTPTASGEWVASYWQDRGTSASRVKWLSPRGSSPVLYNLRSLEADNLEAVVICEGPADTITAALALEGLERCAVVGVPGVSAWRAEWAELVAGLRVVIAADNDEAGERLEEAVRSSVGRAVALVRPKYGDLTDTAKETGLEALRTLLLSTLATQPEAAQRSLEKMTSLLLAHFPGGFFIGEGAA